MRIHKNIHIFSWLRIYLKESLMLEQVLDILKEELVPAEGCTEPIAIAFAGSYAFRACSR